MSDCFVLYCKEMDGKSRGGAGDNAKRPVSKLFISSSHAVSKPHHGDFRYEVPSGDAVTCVDPCFVGVSDLQLGNTGARMSNVVTESMTNCILASPSRVRATPIYTSP